jgi:hypothetical protein
MDMNLNLPVSIGTLYFYYSVVISSLFFVYGAGWIIRSYFFKIKNPVSAFSILCNSVVGLIFVTTIYSIVMTKGSTVNWLVVVLFIIFIFYRAHRKKIKKTEDNISSYRLPVWKYIIIILSINIVFFCYFVYRITDFNQGMFQPYFEDFNYYAKLSQYLTLGYENRFFSFNFVSDINTQPYHYFEIWINALIYKTFGLNALIVYTVSIPMLFDTLIFIALLAIIEFRKKITAWYLGAAFVILLLSDITPYITTIFPAFKGWMPLLESPKLLPIFLFLFLSIALFLHNRKYEAYYILLILPALNVITIVAIWGTIGTILLVSAIRKQKIEWKYWTPFLSIVFLYFIYIVQGVSANSARSGEAFHWGLFRLYITQPILYLSAYAHIIILIFLLDKRYLWNEVKKVWLVFAIAFLISQSVSIFMRPYDYDATQFVSGIITAMIYVFIVYVFLTTITSIQPTLKKKSLTVAFCGISLLISIAAYKNMVRDDTWSHEYEAAILKIIHPEKEYRIGFYLGANDSEGNQNSVIVDAVSIADVLDYYHNNVFHFAVNKGAHEVCYKTDQSPFRIYYAEKKAELPDMSDDEIRINFIRENRIGYIRVFKTAFPSDEFLSHLSLLAEDAVTGQRFYKVK